MKIERVRELRAETESASAVTRHRATLELIAADHYLAYSDARHAARVALSGAHARCGDHQALDGGPTAPMPSFRQQDQEC